MALSSPVSEERVVQLDYGREGVAVVLPAARTTVIRPRHAAPAADLAATLSEALRHPVAGPGLRDIVPPGARVAVSLCDVTRPQPREAMVHALLDELDGLVARADLTLLIA